MKKITVIFAFLLITVFSTGTFLIHLYYLKSYKKEFKSFLKQTKTQSKRSIIYINPSELYTNTGKVTWEDENKEVVYNGILYDIIEIKSVGLKIELTAVSDYQEMILKKQFSEIYDINNHQATKNPFHLLKDFLSLKTIFNHSDDCFEPHTVDISLMSSQNFFIIPSIFISQETPPPDLLS